MESKQLLSSAEDLAREGKGSMPGLSARHECIQSACNKFLTFFSFPGDWQVFKNISTLIPKLHYANQNE